MRQPGDSPHSMAVPSCSPPTSTEFWGARKLVRRFFEMVYDLKECYRRVLAGLGDSGCGEFSLVDLLDQFAFEMNIVRPASAKPHIQRMERLGLLEQSARGVWRLGGKRLKK